MFGVALSRARTVVIVVQPRAECESIAVPFVIALVTLRAVSHCFRPTSQNDEGRAGAQAPLASVECAQALRLEDSGDGVNLDL